ncbi:MAG TPA: fibronectin type III domain-containing protein [Pyrinomonadaceae bacterium]|nr:fibronectin type III domain-containing protein [Pyrinomonadaceae bacterium]
MSTKSSFTVTGLTPGTRYWFRVAAVGAGGQSGWSDPASKIAP